MERDNRLVQCSTGVNKRKGKGCEGKDRRGMDSSRRIRTVAATLGALV